MYDVICKQTNVERKKYKKRLKNVGCGLLNKLLKNILNLFEMKSLYLIVLVL